MCVTLLWIHEKTKNNDECVLFWCWNVYQMNFGTRLWVNKCPETKIQLVTLKKDRKSVGKSIEKGG